MRFLPKFLWFTFLTQRQVERAAGFFGGRLLVDSRRTFWTLTVWESEQRMKGFRGSGPHARVMSRLAMWCDEAAYSHWFTEGLPTWEEAYERFVAEGRLSRVEHPSKSHLHREFPKPRLSPLIGGDLKAIARVTPGPS